MTDETWDVRQISIKVNINITLQIIMFCIQSNWYQSFCVCCTIKIYTHTHLQMFICSQLKHTHTFWNTETRPMLIKPCPCPVSILQLVSRWKNIQFWLVHSYRPHSEGTGKVMFSQASVCLHFGGGGTPSGWWGVLHPSRWGYPHPSNQDWMGVPPH